MSTPIGKNWSLSEGEYFYLLEDLDNEPDLTRLIGLPVDVCTNYSRGFKLNPAYPKIGYEGIIEKLYKLDQKKYLITIRLDNGFTTDFHLNTNWGFVAKVPHCSSAK